ncbi:uncharacterized protein LOC110029222 [Phalaenopsis equestris]|uniref:uncharacterized protein LOC110029222 n=1 Tax=Phalaenopsis equestris TaxID=78828 RepID=UPI0009E420EB|nr:uncharacterized protein LOC110029222 [Phalaenopsis equestris]
MGQALRRVMGRLPSSARSRPSPPQTISCNPELDPPPSHDGGHDGGVAVRDRLIGSTPEDILEKKVESNILEERDPEFDAMLQKMVGTIRSKPGGKLEMGEAFIVQKYKRPLPKVRSSVEQVGSHDQKPLLPGTLTVAQLQEILLLHQGKSGEQKGPIDFQEIAKKFGVDSAQVEQIFQFISLHPENEKNDSKKSN